MGHIVLVGLMGSGKTTVGAALAAALGVPHRDSDVEIEGATGVTARDLARRHGIVALHAMEARHLLDALAEPERTVISAAASTLDDPVCRAALLDPAHLVVWLRADPRVLAARQQGSDHRPEFGPDPVVVLRRQAARRDAAPHEVADVTLDAGRAPEALIAAIRTHADAVR